MINDHAALALEYHDIVNNSTRNYLILSDLHIGFESDIIKKGVNLNSNIIINDILNEIHSIKNSQQFDGLIILGDLKSSITRITKIEWDVIPNFLLELSKDLDVFFVPGNHDGNIDILMPKSVITCNSGGLLIGDTLLIHGHTIPDNTKVNITKIIMGHLHPIFSDPESTLNGKRIWIYLKVRKESIFGNKNKGIIEVIVVPTFNKYYYTSIQKTGKFHKHLSPFMRLLAKKDAILSGFLFTLEGSLIGDISKLGKF